MAYDYDKLYGSTPNALGEPTQVFVDFFKRQSDKSLRVLDVGCGQGRDALFIARMGNSVIGVDISPHGIQELIETARQESLDIEGFATDIVTFVPKGAFDVILIDRTLHMLLEIERLDVLERLIHYVPRGGWVLIADERSNMQGFKDVFAKSDDIWSVELETKGNLFYRHA